MKKRMNSLLIVAILVLSGCNPIYFSSYRITSYKDSKAMKLCAHIQDANDIVEYIETFAKIPEDNEKHGIYILQPSGDEGSECIGYFGLVRQDNDTVLLQFFADGSSRQINKIKKTEKCVIKKEKVE